MHFYYVRVFVSRPFGGYGIDDFELMKKQFAFAWEWHETHKVGCLDMPEVVYYLLVVYRLRGGRDGTVFGFRVPDLRCVLIFENRGEVPKFSRCAPFSFFSCAVPATASGVGCMISRRGGCRGGFYAALVSCVRKRVRKGERRRLWLLTICRRGIRGVCGTLCKHIFTCLLALGIEGVRVTGRFLVCPACPRDILVFGVVGWEV